MTYTVNLYANAGFTAPISSTQAPSLVAACQTANTEASAGRYARILDATGKLIADTYPPVSLEAQPKTRTPAQD